MLNLWSLRTNYHKNGKQWIGKIWANVIGESRYESIRIMNRINYAKFWYYKQQWLMTLSLETPDVVNSFSVLAKEDTSHGFPVWRPLERNSDVALYSINSEGWFQIYSVMSGALMVCFWIYVANTYFAVCQQTVEDEDNQRIKDGKASMIWERTFWAFTFQVHGQHAAAMHREIKFFTNHPDDAKLTVKSTYNRKNPNAPDRYYKGWGQMMDMRLL